MLKSDVFLSERSRKSQTETCVATIEGGCSRPSKTKNLCGGHYQQKRNGKPFTPLRIQRAPRAIGELGVRDALGRKHCYKCDNWLPLASFFSGRHISDGFSPECKQCARDRLYMSNYGIGHDQVEAIFLSQEGKCSICSAKMIWGSKNVHVDHNHVTGEVRSLLCGCCNVGIGYFRDNPNLMLSGIRYLVKNGETINVNLISEFFEDLRELRG